MRLFLMLLKIQWIDRIATSAFLIGITLQTFLLSSSLWHISKSYDHALVLALRGSLLTSVGILVFSAMSAIQNEFRFGTIESVLLGKIRFINLIWIRSICTAIVCSPAILIPFITVAIKYPSHIDTRLIGVLGLVYLYTATTSFQIALILNVFESPAVVLPWAKAAILVPGLEFIPVSYAKLLSSLFPSGWILRMATQDASLGPSIIGFTSTCILWTLIIYGLLRARVFETIERNLISGRTGA